jgi:ribonuclease E
MQEVDASSDGDDKPSGERRSRRRRGGRGRSRRRDGEANAGITGGEASREGSSLSGDTAAQAAEIMPGGDEARTPDQPVPIETAPADTMAQEAVAEPVVVEAVIEPTPDLEVSHPEPEPEPEPEAMPELEPVGAAPTVQQSESQPEPEPVKPAAPKRRGWWSRG